MRRLTLVFTVALALLGAGTLLAACGGSDDPQAVTVRVELGNWYVEPSQETVPAGRVTFRAVHVDDHGAHDGHGAEGGLLHELTVARRLDDGSFEVVDRVTDIEAGESRELTITLAPGEYELQCNLVEETRDGVVAHYEQGMRAPFIVTDS
jgi:uncharacterized cupredoxin-like copper-binding protein